MRNETALEKRTNNTEIASPKTMQELNELGKVFRASGFFPEIKNEAQAVVKIMAGQELGISPMQAMQNIFVISTKEGANIQISSHYIAARIKQSPKYNYLLKEHSNQRCVIEFFEGGERQGEYIYTLQDAQAAGLSGRYIWKSHTKDMLFNRCISGGYKKFCPDVIGMPVYTEGEFADAEVVPSEQPSAVVGQRNGSGDSGLGTGDEKENVKVVNAEDILNSGQPSAVSASTPLSNQQPETDNQQPETSSQQPTTNNRSSDRPYSIPILLDRYEKIAATDQSQASADEVLNAMKSIKAGTQNSEPKQKAVLHFFTGKKKVEELTVGECLFFQKWIGHKKGKAVGWLDPEHPEAIQEIDTVYETVLSQETGDDDPFADDLFGRGDD